MKEIKKELERKRAQFEAWRDTAQKFSDTAPKKTLKVITSRGKLAFASRSEDPEHKITYIPKSDKSFKEALAQKEYYLKVVRLLDRSIHAIDHFLKYYPEESIYDIYEEMHWAKKALVVPLRPTNEEYETAWRQEEYEGLAFSAGDAGAFYTDLGERVRSKSEVIIANFLNKMNIPYKYERPLVLGGRKVHPDFTILDIRNRKEKYLEHFGMMGEFSYSANAAEKIRLYEANGFYLGESLFCTFETERHPLDTRELKSLVERMLKSHP